jgi:hypothetical protein
MVRAVVEGPDKRGTIHLNFKRPKVSPPAEPPPAGKISPSAAIAPEDMTRWPRSKITKDGAVKYCPIPVLIKAVSITPSQEGLSFAYDTGTLGWAAAGGSYDDFTTPSFETADLSRVSEVHVTLQDLTGGLDEVKFELTDINENKASVMLEGIRRDINQVWVIPMSRFQGIDLEHIKLFLPVVEGQNRQGILDFGWKVSGQSLGVAPRLVSDVSPNIDIGKIIFTPQKPARLFVDFNNLTRDFTPEQANEHLKLLSLYNDVLLPGQKTIKVIYYNVDPSHDFYDELKDLDKVAVLVPYGPQEAFRLYGAEFKGNLLHISKEGIDAREHFEGVDIDLFRYQGDEIGLLYALIIYSETDKNKAGFDQRDGYFYIVGETLQKLVQDFDNKISLARAA